MAKTLLEDKSNSIDLFNNYFSHENVIKKFEQILNCYEYSSDELEFTTDAQSIYSNQKEYESAGFKQRAFESYLDPIAEKFLQAYC
jgi:hypothetical protein